MSGPQDAGAAGREWLRVGQADRERVIEALKDAFVQGRLTRDELGARTGQALSARTYADLAAVTAGILSRLAAAGPASPPASARRRPLTRTAVGSLSCLAIAFAAVLADAQLQSPLGPNPYAAWIPLFVIVAGASLCAAGLIVVTGVANALESRRSRQQLPPTPGPAGHILDG